MTTLARLLTLVDINDTAVSAGSMSIAAVHEAVLVDGRHIRLLDGRGWTSTLMTARRESAPGDRSPERVPDIWDTTSVEEIESHARMVVGPDEPFGGCSQEDAEAGHWAFLRDVLLRRGVAVDAAELQRLRHDVVLSERLLARVGRASSDDAHA
jgi:hypothetical protein